MRLPVLHLRPIAGPFRVSRIQLALRAALAASLSLAIAAWCALEFPIYAMLAAVIVTDLDPAQTRYLGLRRLLATVVGAACGATLNGVLPSGPWAVGLGILIAMLICQLLQAHEAAKVAGYICGIVVLCHGGDSWSYALLRLLETTLGIAMAWSVSLIPKFIQVDEAP